MPQFYIQVDGAHRALLVSSSDEDWVDDESEEEEAGAELVRGAKDAVKARAQRQFVARYHRCGRNSNGDGARHGNGKGGRSSSGVSGNTGKSNSNSRSIGGGRRSKTQWHFHEHHFHAVFGVPTILRQKLLRLLPKPASATAMGTEAGEAPGAAGEGTTAAAAAATSRLSPTLSPSRAYRRHEAAQRARLRRCG